MEEERVCCLCGDVGFPHKLFHCSRCRFRFQHSYCSNYYNGSIELSSSSSSSSISTCDWCQSEVGTRIGNNSNNNNNNPSRIKLSSSTTTHQIKVGSNNNKNNNNTGGSPSPRPNSHRRYKLLKDVMC